MLWLWHRLVCLLVGHKWSALTPGKQGCDYRPYWDQWIPCKGAICHRCGKTATWWDGVDDREMP